MELFFIRCQVYEYTYFFYTFLNEKEQKEELISLLNGAKLLSNDLGSEKNYVEVKRRIEEIIQRKIHSLSFDYSFEVWRKFEDRY